MAIGSLLASFLLVLLLWLWSLTPVLAPFFGARVLVSFHISFVAHVCVLGQALALASPPWISSFGDCALGGALPLVLCLPPSLWNPFAASGPWCPPGPLPPLGAFHWLWHFLLLLIALVRLSYAGSSAYLSDWS